MMQRSYFFFATAASTVLLAASCQTGGLAPTVHLSPKLPEDQIQSKVLTYTPVGSDKQAVMTFVHSRLKHRGDPYFSPTPAVKHHRRGPTSVGVHSVTVCLGEYGFPGRRVTFIHWALDSDDRVLDVIVAKERDSL